MLTEYYSTITITAPLKSMCLQIVPELLLLTTSSEQVTEAR